MEVAETNLKIKKEVSNFINLCKFILNKPSKKKRDSKPNKYKTPDIFRENEFLKFYINSSCFIKLVTNNMFIKKLYEFLNALFDRTNVREQNCYREDCDELYILNCDRPVNIMNIVTIKSVIFECDKLITELNKLKELTTQKLIESYDKSIKYADFAEEECDVVEKLLIHISKIDKYDYFNNEIVDTLIYNSIQRHTFIMSISIPIVISMLISSSFTFQLIKDFPSRYSTEETKYRFIYKNMFFLPISDTYPRLFL